MKKIVLFIALSILLVGCANAKESEVVYLMDEIECDGYNITIDTIEFAYEINPVTKDGAYTSYVVSEEDSIFFHVIVAITNVTQEMDWQQELDLTVIHESTTYFAEEKIELENNFASTYTTDQDTYMHFIFEVPYEMSEDSLALEMTFNVGDNEYVLEDQNDITNPGSYQEAMMLGYQEVELNEVIEIEDLCSLKVTTLEYSDIVEPTNHDYFYTFYDLSLEESKYGHVVFEIEYLGQDDMELEDLLEVIFVLEDYQSYLGTLLLEESDGSDFITGDYESMEQGDTVTIHAIAKIEDEKITGSNVLRFVIGEQKYCMAIN